MDVFTPEKRSDVMSRIRSRDTKPELIAKSVLWSNGFRYARTNYGLPGSPDIVLPKYHSVIFVHGCFWHGHTCKHGRLPKSNSDYWIPKIKKNMTRDAKAIRQLRALGWHCYQVWECRLALDLGRTMKRLRSEEI